MLTPNGGTDTPFPAPRSPYARLALSDRNAFNAGMPIRIPRRSLGVEITLTLVLKTAALAVIGVLLFGPDDRVRPDRDALAEAIVGELR
jgi:hypothetical protein